MHDETRSHKRKKRKIFSQKTSRKIFSWLVTANIPCLNSIKLPSIPSGITTAITIVAPFAPQGISTTLSCPWAGAAMPSVRNERLDSNGRMERGRREARRDEMLTRTLAQWIFQRVKTPKPASNIPASIFVSLSAAEFSQPASVLPIAATGSWGGIEMSAAAAWHATLERYETKPIVDGEREREREKAFEKRFHFILPPLYSYLLSDCPDFLRYSRKRYDPRILLMLRTALEERWSSMRIL